MSGSRRTESAMPTLVVVGSSGTTKYRLFFHGGTKNLEALFASQSQRQSVQIRRRRLKQNVVSQIVCTWDY